MNTTSYMPVWLTNGVRRTFIAMTVVLAIGLTSCSDKNEIDDPTTHVTPATPVNPEDYVTVPVAGGTITKGDISITFPSGTFSTDKKVAITEVKKGNILGEDEASKFYQVTIPITTHEPMTISVQSDKLDDDVQLVLQSQGYARSANKMIDANNILETTYTDGRYVAKLPILENEDESVTDYFSVGLAHITTVADGGAQVKTRASAVAEGQVKGVKWKLYIDPKGQNVTGSWKVLNAVDIAKMNTWIRSTITQLTDLGYELSSKDTEIPYYYVSEPDKWGCFQQHWMADCYSWIGISVEKLINSPNDTLSFKSTLLHETFHYFQANNYDPRCAAKKSGGTKWGWAIVNENILYEMGAVWMEKFTLKGKMDADFLRTTVFMGNLEKLGFEREEERWSIVNPNDDAETKANKKNEAMQQQGYTMAPILYYFTKEMGAFGFKDASVLELHKLWKQKWNSSSYTSYHILNEWVKNHDSHFFESYGIDDYYLQLWSGKLIDDLSITKVKGSKDANIGKFGTFPLSGQCYPYGCNIRSIVFGNLKDISLQNSELVVKQESPNVHTYLLIAVYNSQTKTYSYGYYKRNGENICIEKGDSMVVRGETLEKYKSEDGTMKCFLYTITTNISNKMHSTTINPYQASIEFRSTVSVSPDSLAFTADGGTQSTYIKYGSYSYYGAEVRAEGHGWCGVEAPGGPSGEIKVTVQPNTTNKKRECIIDCYVMPKGDSPESEKIKMPVKVTQEAGEGKGGLYHIEAYIIGKISADYSTTLQSGTVATGVTTYDIDFYAETDIEYSGGDLQIQISDDDNTPETLSFTVSNLTGDYTGSSAHNIKYVKETGIAFAAKYVRDENNYTATTLEISSLPVDAGSAYKSDYGGTLWFIGSGTSGLQGVSFKHHWEEDTTDGMYGPVNGHKSGDATYRSDENNHLSLKCGFWRKSDSSSAPRRLTSKTKIPYLPVNSATAPSRTPLPTQAKARIQ